MKSIHPTHVLQPVGNSSTEILRTFALDKPLSADQINFLDFHQKQLSSKEFDPVLRYYLQRYTGENKYHTSFLLPHEIVNHEAIKLLKKRLQLMLLNQPKKSATLNVTPKQFLEFKETGMQELIFWHGNQLLTGASMFPGGTPPVLFFQWGNFFGVVKYVVLAEEKSLKANLLIYFEDRQDRELDQCVQDYNLKLVNEKKEQHDLLHEHRIEPIRFSEFLIKTPRLTR